MRMTMIKNEKQAAASGRGTALGRSGTAWMAALPTIVDEVVEKSGLKEWPPQNEDAFATMMDRLQEYAEGWLETEQFRYEVGDYLTTSMKGEGRFYRILALQDAWVEGYLEILLDKVVAKLTA